MCPFPSIVFGGGETVDKGKKLTITILGTFIICLGSQCDFLVIVGFRQDLKLKGASFCFKTNKHTLLPSLAVGSQKVIKVFLYSSFLLLPT